MTHELKIPMRPEDLPQQRIHEVVGLPERPAEFNFEVGYGCSFDWSARHGGPVTAGFAEFKGYFEQRRGQDG